MPKRFREAAAFTLINFSELRALRLQPPLKKEWRKITHGVYPEHSRRIRDDRNCHFERMREIFPLHFFILCERKVMKHFVVRPGPALPRQNG